MINRHIAVFLLVSLVSFFDGFSQATVRGTINDLLTGESIVGAHVIVKGSLTGTLSDAEGRFNLNTPKNPPFTLVFSALGYDAQEVEIYQVNREIEILLFPQKDSQVGVVVTANKVEDVVLSASKLAERTLEAPITTHKLGLLSLREIPNVSMYAGLEYLPEVQLNRGSFSFLSMNTRGFADMQNWRFVHLLDGVDIIGPGLNYAVGDLTGSSELDLSNIEVVVGPGSALYGPNAFNGALVMNTKSPFDYEGVSAYIKGGVTVQEANGTNSLGDFAVRIAKSFNDKFAFKLNVSYLSATDWEADDQSHFISNTNVANQEELLSRPRNHPNYNAVSVYGDEIAVPVILDGSGNPSLINRSGIPERDIVNYGIQNIKAGAALHYRINTNLEAIYDVRFMEGDAILRHTTTYPFRDIRLFTQKFELRSDNFYIRGYHSKENANNSYSMLATGAFLQEGLKSSSLWANEYGAAFRGEIAGVEAGNHTAAREFADRDIPGPSSNLFQELRSLSLENPDIKTGGSKFIDHTSMLNLDFNYDLKKHVKAIGLQLGGSYRQYQLDSQGKIFNDGPLGFNSKIPITEFGAYIQATRRILNDRLTLRGSARLDKNQNFKAKITPRASAVLSLGEKREHNFRLSYQTGFRNPASQEAYIALDLGEAIILGGTENNISRYNYDLGGGNLVNGSDIHSQLVTIPSFTAFLASGGSNPELLELANLPFLKQEGIKAIEFGYNADIADQLQFGFNIYRNEYENLVSRIVAFSLLTNRPYAVYTNIAEKITSLGSTFSMIYTLRGGYKIGGNYTIVNFDAEEAVANNPGFLPSFNTPKNRINLLFGNRNFYKGLGISLRFRWSDSYLWQSPFGQGEIESFSQLDGALSYKIPKIRATIKLGGSNLLRKEYRHVYGGPYIGSVYYLSLTIDEFKLKK